jgi:hypothetical protein
MRITICATPDLITFENIHMQLLQHTEEDK